MPLVGFNDPVLGKISLADALERARAHNDPLSIPSEVYSYVIGQQQERGEMISPSAITGCIRKTYLSRTNDYYQSLENLWSAARGTLFHFALEANKEEGAIVEQRFCRTLGSGITIFAKPDAIYPAYKKLRDWKTTAFVPLPNGKFNNGYPNHHEQLNEYVYVLSKPDGAEPIPIEKIEITYMDMNRVRTVEAPIWKEEKTRALLEDNGEILKRAFDNGEIPDVPKEYPHYKLCDYCPDEIKEICSRVWELDHRK